tara:strand:+ start:739 stop:1032 length:294 start_codon:yes stop_codon:yes gene_type:complete
MMESPDAIMVYIPLMKGLGMNWSEIKNTPRNELMFLLGALNEHTAYHSMDGYTDKHVNDLAKENPQIRSQYAAYLEKRRKYEEMMGIQKEVSFGGLK